MEWRKRTEKGPFASRPTEAETFAGILRVSSNVKWYLIKSSVPEKYLRAMYGIEFTPFFVAPTFVGTGHKWVKSKDLDEAHDKL